MTNEARYYGVSYGNGNDGVSHMFADFYVKTDDPWRLARLAMVSEFKPGEGQAFALDEMQVDGEADYTISAVIYEPPLEDGEEPAEEGMSYCDANGAWMICEVFPEDDMREGRPTYDSLDDAFAPESLALVPAVD